MTAAVAAFRYLPARTARERPGALLIRSASRSSW